METEKLPLWLGPSMRGDERKELEEGAVDGEATMKGLVLHQGVPGSQRGDWLKGAT